MEPFQDTGTATTFSVKTSGGRVRFIRVTNANAAVRYFQLHNKATAPSGGDTAAYWFLLPAGTAAVPSVVQISRSDLDQGLSLATGVGVALSTTAATYTAATNGDHTTSIFYN